MNGSQNAMKQVADELQLLVTQFKPQLLGLTDDPELATRPRPEKWSRKEILGHLIDSACNNQQKFVRMMQHSRLEFPGYAQDDWVLLQNWSAADWENMILLWQCYNQHLAYLIESIPSKYYGHEIIIEGTGPFRLDFIMPDYVEHLKHHLRQIFPDSELKNSFVNVYNA